MPDVSSLAGTQTIERRLLRGDDHRYTIALRGGEYARVLVAPRGIDVAVQTLDAGGRPIANFDDDVRTDGAERVDLVADTAGTYAIAVTASPVASADGSYTLALVRRAAATDRDRALQHVRRLRAAADARGALGQFDEAAAVLDEALTVLDRVPNVSPVDVAQVRLQAAENAIARRDDEHAQAFAAGALGAFERASGAEDPYAAKARSILALIAQHRGEGRAAERLVQQSLAVFERTVGVTHRWYAQALVTQANVRFDAGDLESAEALDRRGMQILDTLQDTETAAYTSLLNNLGEVYWRRGDNARAEALFDRALAKAERLEGADSVRASMTLQDLGIIARERLDYQASLDYTGRALAIRERRLGPDHADLAPLLNNLAIVYRVMGDTDRALGMLLRALDIREQTVGPYHRGTLNAVGNIARTYAVMGRTASAIAFERRADAIVEKQLALNLAVGSERQKLAFARSVAERTDRTLSLHLLQAPGDAEAASLAALVILQRKGRVQDAMADVLAAVRSRIASEADRALLDQLRDSETQLAHAALEPSTGAGRPASIADLESRKDRLEAELSERSDEFRSHTRAVTVEAVQAAVPADAALIECAVYRPFDPSAERNADAYGPPHYAAYVIRRRGVPAGIDLGPVEAIDRAIGAWRAALRDPTRRDVDVQGRAVDELIMRRVRAHTGDAGHLIISPDGNLNLVPFEALVDEQGRYAIERTFISYVTSGRDLLRTQPGRPPAAAPLIVADPDFGGDRAHVAVAESRPRVGRARAIAGADFKTAYFAPLSATAAEGRAIQALFPTATLAIGAMATKRTLVRAHAPQILHVASHGFFLDDRSAGASISDRNPLLRSGLALAGANLASSGNTDGILTALEASALDLWGTKLVTLSACDTGVGQVRNGEGVYGLRRALVLAGAETLVMSLWPVSDYIARDAMVAYYTGLRAGLGRGEALRSAKLATLRRANRRHPYYWAAFIQSGEWADLNGRR